MSGEMRRPPQLWEQKLARTTAILGVGISTSGDATAIVTPTPPPGGGGGTEPAPVPPPAGAFTTPSKPTLFRQVQGLGVLWDGLNADGDLWPYDTSWVEIHADTSGSAFTPSDATLKGRLARPGIYSIGGLTQGSTYFVRLRGADPAGNYTAAGAAESAITGGTITAVYISGGTMAAGYLSGGTISGGFITGGTITGALIQSTSISGYASSSDIANFITGSDVNSNVTSISGGVITSGTIIGRTVMSAESGKRIVLNAADNQIDFYNSSGTKTTDLNPITIRGQNGLAVSGALDVGTLLDVSNTLWVGEDVKATGFLYSDELTGSDSTSVPNLRANTDTGQIVRTTHANSAQRFKHEIIPLSDVPLAAAVDASLVGDAMNQAVDPLDVLSLVPVQYRRNESPSTVVTGFIAEDVEAKFPTAATYDERGDLEAIDVRSIVAGLLAVAQQQQATITALTARIEALEA